jgi:hypothetical protein
MSDCGPDPFLSVLERIALALERAYPPSEAEKFEALIRAERAASPSITTEETDEEDDK